MFYRGHSASLLANVNGQKKAIQIHLNKLSNKSSKSTGPRYRRFYEGSNSLQSIKYSEG